jgi:hypothetical protein
MPQLKPYYYGRRAALDNPAAATLKLHPKPGRKRDRHDDDDAPDDWRHLFRAAASRRIVGSVVKFSLHETPFGYGKFS